MGSERVSKPPFCLVLQRCGVSHVSQKRKAQMSGCELSTQKNGNGGWSSFPGSKESLNRFPIACRG